MQFYGRRRLSDGRKVVVKKIIWCTGLRKLIHRIGVAIGFRKRRAGLEGCCSGVEGRSGVCGVWLRRLRRT